MNESQQSYRYIAVAESGRRIRGVVTARDDAQAYERLRQQGLSPLRLRGAATRRSSSGKGLSERETIDLIGNLAELLRAGADMRTAFGILGARATRPAFAAVCRNLAGDIGGGEALDIAFGRHMGRRATLVAAMVAAGEAAGDLAGGLTRARDMIQSELSLRDKLTSILAYPAFVLVSTVAAVFVLLLFIIPTLAPLTQSADSQPPPALQAMIWASQALNDNLALLGAVALAGLATIMGLHLAGGLRRLIDHLTLEGPARRTAERLVFGGFAIAAGGMLSAGAPMSDTLRLAIRAVESPIARRRLEPVLQDVRQGEALSLALERVKGFPAAIARLATVGEATGSLGPMLQRAGKLEEEAAVRRIERVGQLLGPALIIVLGGLIGLLMASLLSGVSEMGATALQ